MEFLKQTFAAFSKDRCTTMAAALAYYTAFALPPLLYLLLTVLTFGLTVAYEGDHAKEKAQSVLKEQATEILGNESAAEGIATILENNRESGGAWWKTLLSFAGIIVGATGVVGALQDSLNRVWQVKPDPEKSSILTILGKRLVSFSMILGLGFLLLVSIVVSSVFSRSSVSDKFVDQMLATFIEDFASLVFDQLRPDVAADRNASIHMMEMIAKVALSVSSDSQRLYLVRQAGALRRECMQTLADQRGLNLLRERNRSIIWLLRDPIYRKQVLDTGNWIGHRA